MKEQTNFEFAYQWLVKTRKDTAAITYLNNGDKERVNLRTAAYAISNAFDWHSSPEGYDYWEELSHEYKNHVYGYSKATEPDHTGPTQCPEVLAEEIAVKPKHYNENEAYDVYSFAIKNNLGMLEGNVVKYVSRHDKKNGKEDLLKAIETLQRLIKEKY